MLTKAKPRHHTVMATESTKPLVESTVWVIDRDECFAAIRADGTIVTVGKFKAQIENTLRHMAADETANIKAIATVVLPRRRQPNRKITVKRLRSF